MIKERLACALRSDMRCCAMTDDLEYDFIQNDRFRLGRSSFHNVATGFAAGTGGAPSCSCTRTARAVMPVFLRRG